MRPELMFLKDSAVTILADVAAGQVGADGRNDRTGRVCSQTLNFLTEHGAVRKAERVGRSRRRYEVTAEGADALTFHRGPMSSGSNPSRGAGRG